MTSREDIEADFVETSPSGALLFFRKHERHTDGYEPNMVYAANGWMLAELIPETAS